MLRSIYIGSPCGKYFLPRGRCVAEEARRPKLCGSREGYHARKIYNGVCLCARREHGKTETHGKNLTCRQNNTISDRHNSKHRSSSVMFAVYAQLARKSVWCIHFYIFWHSSFGRASRDIHMPPRHYRGQLLLKSTCSKCSIFMFLDTQKGDR